MSIHTAQELKSFIEEPHSCKPKLLLHACCAPCSSAVLELLRDAFDITIFFYNPNIYPKEEYDKRLAEFAKLGNYPLIEGPYSPDAFYEDILGMEELPEGSHRCFTCYEIRLEETAKVAAQNNFDFFTTTLSISPYKNAEKINEIGLALEDDYGVSFLYSNFKKNDGYKRSIELCKELGIYRQSYCGCIFSYEDMRKRTTNHQE